MQAAASSRTQQPMQKLPCMMYTYNVVGVQHNIYLQWVGKMMLNGYLDSSTGFALFQLPCSNL